MGAYAKALGSGLAGAVTLIGVWGLNLARVEVPAEVALALQTVITTAIVYFLPNSPKAS
jgi:hypothetical protein